MSEINLTIEDVDLLALYGEKNVKLNLLREAFPDISITARGNALKLTGDTKQSQNAKAKLETMVRMLKEKKQLSTQVVEDLLNGGTPYETQLSGGKNNSTILHGRNGKSIKPKTQNQRRLVLSSEENDIVFAVGPAGTGKTYVAVAMAVKALKNKVVKKIILTRPAVEAGENLGFLPGDLKDKVDPYLRPLYDALDDMIPAERLKYFIDNRTIEIAPLAFMRGRTLDNAFVILDESQNSTTMQIKMFLTRLGPSAKAIITGDLSQVDLPRNVKSGLRSAVDTLSGIKGIGIVKLSAEDVVRHRLVKEIILAYSRKEEQEMAERAAWKEEQDAKRKKDAEAREARRIRSREEKEEQ